MCTFPHPADSSPHVGLRAWAEAVVADLDLQLMLAVPDLHVGFGTGTGMFHGVGQRLLDDPIPGEIHDGRQGNVVPMIRS